MKEQRFVSSSTKVYLSTGVKLYGDEYGYDQHEEKITVFTFFFRSLFIYPFSTTYPVWGLQGELEPSMSSSFNKKAIK